MALRPNFKLKEYPIIKKTLNKFGVDGAIFYTSISRVIQAFGGFVSIFFVAHYLTGVEQGFYYTFGSILAIQVFFEMGLNGIITQYVAHEVSHLKWDSETTLSGSPAHSSRLSSLLHFVTRYYLFFSGFLLVVLTIIGLIFFNKYDTSNGSVTWVIPWFILTFTTTVSFIFSPYLAFVEGLGKVKQVAKIRIYQQVISLLTVWFFLLFGAKLYSVPIAGCIGLVIMFYIFFAQKHFKLLSSIWKSAGDERIHYKSEIFPFQWKIAISWISGYFIFQLFNPVLFATDGPVVAGQMGMTLAILNGLFGLSWSWMSTKVPLFSGLIAQRNYVELDRIFDKTLKQSAIISGAGLLSIFSGIFFLRYFGFSIGDRFLPYAPLILMLIPFFLNHFIASWATYLRCHKLEPFLIPSIVGAITTSLSTLLMGKYFGVIGITSGYALLTFTGGFIWGYFIFKSKKAIWHKSY